VERTEKALALCIGIALAGCGSKNAECSLEARAGVNVVVVDAATKKPICDAKVVITDDTGFTDTPPPVGAPECVYGGASERAGTYQVEVTHPSYATATRDGIGVAMDEAQCHVIAQRVELALSPP
jgi:hypothetical protein